MIVLGLTTSVVVDHHEFATPQSDPSFLGIQLADMLAFSVLGGAAIALRRAPDAHKRLMILATIFIADAGFSRWWAPGLEKLLGDGCTSPTCWERSWGWGRSSSPSGST
jgi:hypothetical protein